MNHRSLYAVLTRFGIAAAVLTALLVIAPAAAQEADDASCKGTDPVTCSYAENGTDPVATFSATDEDDDTLKWGLEGADHAVFDITGGVLTFKESPDYEDPGDSNFDADDSGSFTDHADDAVENDNTYEVTVTATEVRAEGDTETALKSTLAVIVNVSNEKEAGTAVIDLRQPEVGTELTGSATDLDNIDTTADVNYEWSIPKVSRPVLDNDAHWQARAAASTTATYTPVAGDVGMYLRLKVSYTDGKGSDAAYVKSEFTVRADVADGDNSSPAFATDAAITREVPENSAEGTAVGGPVAATDPDARDADKLTYSIPTTGDAASFTIDKATGQLRVGDPNAYTDSEKLDKEEGSTDDDGVYSVTVTVTDPSGEGGAEDNDTIVVNISATDVDEAPGVQGATATTDPDTMHTIPENTNLADDEGYVDATGFAVTPDTAFQYLATITDTDNSDETVSLKLGGDDASAFKLLDLDGEGAGVVQVLLFASDPNYEDAKDADGDSTYKVDVIAVDKAGNEKPVTVTVVVENVQEAGTVDVMPVQPAIGREVTAELKDQDGTFTDVKWQWYGVSTKPADTDTDGTIEFTELVTPRKIDGATSSTYTPRAEVKDDDTTEADESYPGDEGDFLVATVSYKDAAPAATADDPATTDVDESAQSILGAAANAVRAVPDVNTAPYFEDDPVELKVKESAEKGDAVGTVSAKDDENDIRTYTLTGGADMASFKVSAGGEVTVNTDLDYDDGQRMYTIEVTATDPFGMSGMGTVTIEVENVNEKPEVTGEVSKDGYDENGTDPVATFSATDEDDDTLKWGLEGADHAVFDITGGVLTFKESPDYEDPGDSNFDADDSGSFTDHADDAVENDNVYEVTVTATEVRAEDDTETALSGSKAVIVTVNNVKEAGTAVIDLRQPEVGTELTGSATDLDNIDTTADVNYEWSIPKVDRPVLDNDAHWQARAAASTTATYTPVAGDVGVYLRLKVSYTDGKGSDAAYVKSEFTVRADVADGDNSSPAFATDAAITREVPENSAEGTAVGGPVAATDPDARDADKLTYSIPTTGDAASFTIDKATGQLRVGDPNAYTDSEKLDKEEGSTDDDGVYSVTVTVTDPSGEGGAEDNDTIVVNISATDVDEAPGVQGATATTDPDTMHTIPENTNLADDEGYVDATGFAVTPDTAFQYLATITDTDNSDETVSLKLGGDDASAFKLLDLDGEGAGVVQVLLFASDPNYEDAKDADGDSTYKVDVIAVDKAGNEKPVTVTVVVENVQEAGTVDVMPVQPAIGREVTAELKDQDGTFTDVKWQWYGVSTKPADTDTDGTIEFTELVTPRKIDGATSSTYTPRAEVKDDDTTEADESYPGDEGDFLVATVSYKDAAPAATADDPATTDVDESAQSILGAAANAVRAVPDVNTAPYFEDDPVELKVKESAEKGDAVGTVSAKDDENDRLTYTLTGGADMASFKVSAGGEVTVNTDLDYDDGQRMYTIEVTATDPFGMSGMGTVTIEVENVNEKPSLKIGPGAPAVNVAPEFDDGDTASFTIDENVTVGSAVGQVSVTDVGDVLTLTDDSDLFAVDNNGNITTAMEIDYESAASHTVEVTATDDDPDTPLSDTITVTITVTNVVECEDVGATAVADRTNTGLMADCEALLLSKSALEGDGGDELNWSNMTPIDQWNGFQGHAEYPSLSGDPMRVTALHLQRSGLKGTIPDSIGDLSALRFINVHSNSLTGDLSALNGMTTLDRVTANNNELDSIGDLSGATGLRILWVHRNEDRNEDGAGGGMNGSQLPMASTLPPNIEWLSMYDNAHIGNIPDLSSLTSLDRLYLHANNLSGQVPASLGDIDSLTVLHLRHNNLTGAIPGALGDLSNLRWLTLDNNRLSGEIPTELGSLSTLNRLYLSNNSLSGEIPSELGDLSALTHLLLRDNQLTGDIPAELGNLSNLVWVRIAENSGLTGCVPAGLVADGVNSDAAELNLPTCGSNGNGNGNGGS